MRKQCILSRFFSTKGLRTRLWLTIEHPPSPFQYNFLPLHCFLQTVRTEKGRHGRLPTSSSQSSLLIPKTSAGSGRGPGIPISARVKGCKLIPYSRKFSKGAKFRIIRKRATCAKRKTCKNLFCMHMSKFQKLGWVSVRQVHSWDGTLSLLEQVSSRGSESAWTSVHGSLTCYV